MKDFIFAIGFVLFCGSATAQSKLLAHPGSKGIVIEHIVAPKESLYSLSRIYHIYVGDLAVANDFDKNRGLVIGEKVRIPLTQENFDQKTGKGIPVYYQVKEKEGLATVSNKFNKIALKELRTWNKLSKDELKKDQYVIVGFIPEPLKAEEVIVKTSNAEDASQEVVIPEKIVPAQEEVVKEPVTPVEEKAVVKEKPHDPQAEEKGYFKNLYAKSSHAEQTHQKAVTSGIFKTNSGWTDGKYYLLMDDVAPGTVAKVTNPMNNTSIYARVLGPMKGIRFNEGLDVRISEAGASTLKITDIEKFIISVTY